MIPQVFQQRQNEFSELCGSHGMKSVYLFGSALTEEFDPAKSDFDFLVEINETDPVSRGEKLLSFWNKSEKLFNRKVDLLTSSNLKNPFLKSSVDNTKVLIYEA